MKQWTYREFIRVLTKNGYSLDRCSGDHNIFINGNGQHISVSFHLVSVIANRLVKENHLNINV